MTLIQNGYVLDGLGNAPVRADVLIRDGRIAGVGQFEDIVPDRKIDASGCWVTPGFVDIHRHPDLAVLAGAFGPAELLQGITTAVGGNCGLSPVPMRDSFRQESLDALAPCLGTAEIPVFDRMDGYLEAIGSDPVPVNYGMLAAAGAVKIWAKGFGAAPFSEPEMANARSKLREMLEEGALGVSLGIMYTPECYTTTEEYIRWLSAAAPFGRPVCCHIRGEGASLCDSVREVIRIGYEAGLPVHISHFKATGIRHWGSLIYKAMACIEAARSRGQDVTADFYPYDAGASTLSSLIPPELLADGLQALSERAESADVRTRMKKALYGENGSWDNMVKDIGWERIILTGGAGAVAYAGKDFTALAATFGDEDPCDTFCRILHLTGGKAGIVVRSMSIEDVQAVAAKDYTFLISDALYGAGAAHPRQKGAFPHFLKKFVPGVLPMTEAVRKMTSMPADRLGLDDLGRLTEGARADIAVFDMDEFSDRATYLEPEKTADGLRLLMINGQVTVENGDVIRSDAGRILRA